jgi:hypothetical protein
MVFFPLVQIVVITGENEEVIPSDLEGKVNEE